MKIAYLYKRHVLDADGLDADKVFADDETTKRMERAAMIDGGRLRSGDTLLLRDLADLGKPSEGDRLRRLIEGMGVMVQVIPLPVAPKPLRKVWLSPTDEQQADLCRLWYSTLPPSYVLQSAERIMGRKVSRPQLDRLCGPRDGSRKTGKK
jgi:hypothetical protein